MSDTFFSTCEHILSATANGLYQGVLIVIIAAIALRIMRTNAATRHAVWFGVLLLVAALIPAHYFVSFGSSPENLIAPMPSTIRITSNETVSPISDATPDSPTSEVDIAGFPATQLAIEPKNVSDSTVLDSSNTSIATAWTNVRSKLLAITHNLNCSIHLPRWATLGLLSAWVLLAGVRLLLVARRVGEVLRAKTDSAAPSARLYALFERLRASMSTRGRVQLRISHAHRTAVVLGFFHPVVLLPVEMDKEEDSGELEHVLRHELAHVNRRDDWSNLAQLTIQAALFFHPAVWWISSRLSLEREIACDDHVLEGSGRPRSYALTLANMASRVQHGRPLLAPGVSNNNSQLQERITMILNTQRDRSPSLAPRRLGYFTTATALIAALAIYAGPRLVLAQPSAPAPSASTSSETASQPDVAVAAGPSAALPPGPDGPDSAPREKASASDDAVSATPAIVSVAPAAALPSTPMMIAVAPGGPVTLMPPSPPAPAARASRRVTRDMSIEDRLDRIERILDRLQAREGAKDPSRREDSSSNYKSMKPVAMPDYPAMVADEARKAAEQAMRSAEAGKRAAEAGQRVAEKAMRDAEAYMNRNFDRSSDDGKRADSKASDEELQALRSAREALQTNLKTLQDQIRRLENEQRKLLRQGQPGKYDDDSKKETPAPKAP